MDYDPCCSSRSEIQRSESEELSQEGEMSFAGSMARRQRLGAAANFQVEGLERRVLLSTAIAACQPQRAFPTGMNPLEVAEDPHV
jgi:hypothetical protein